MMLVVLANNKAKKCASRLSAPGVAETGDEFIFPPAFLALPGWRRV
jgi:hypothetical protein